MKDHARTNADPAEGKALIQADFGAGNMNRRLSPPLFRV
jgi:hypothetical protein